MCVVRIDHEICMNRTQRQLYTSLLHCLQHAFTYYIRTAADCLYTWRETRRHDAISQLRDWHTRTRGTCISCYILIPFGRLDCRSLTVAGYRNRRFNPHSAAQIREIMNRSNAITWRIHGIVFQQEVIELFWGFYKNARLTCQVVRRKLTRRNTAGFFSLFFFFTNVCPICE